ncbi:hypothetical protein [Cytobacillus horneckiae]|uniref:Uncharacterized protein n=1 Tax=Cytobacillus horneckiae TaxID=549687 RepID=A0A2N0ZAZ3_9BACI|nr:hypothetical protein [Cytobacillus horneckiae]MEC1158706.1 hypothetical protein [Cytobacillus horneckiae]NRG46664.1 hypothetical protein [Bacillus sp. CRN 9]PKG26684.1 hypothetical protein CWS20_22820 [Cytobacillus horneckiae]
MKVKNVLSIRITKRDKDIEDYLEEFPQDKQNAAIKEIAKYGIKCLKENYERENLNKSIERHFHSLKEEHNRKFDQIFKQIDNISLANNGEVYNKNNNINIDINNNNDVDIDKTKQSFQDAMKMFMT